MTNPTYEQYRANDSFPCGYEVSLIASAPDMPIADGIRDFTTCGTYERACEIMERWAARAARQFDANAIDCAAIYVSGCDDERTYQIRGAFVGL